MRRESGSPIGHGHHHRRAAQDSPIAGATRAIAGIDSCTRLRFSELYATAGIIGLRLSEKARDLAGQPVIITGYMAPPLDLMAGFFVLTRAPIMTCPFCDPSANWPDDLVLSLPDGGGAFADPDLPIEVAGVLDVGRKPDPRTGAVRLVRLLDAEWRTPPPPT